MSTTRTHDCPGGCGKQVNNTLFACRADWAALPWAMRQDILVTHQAGPPAAFQHLQAMHRARRWYAERRLAATS